MGPLPKYSLQTDEAYEAFKGFQIIPSRVSLLGPIYIVVGGGVPNSCFRIYGSGLRGLCKDLKK